LTAGADGVHVGQHDLSVRDVRRIAGRNLVVGVSTHNLDEARPRAVEDGADYCGVGAMFASSTKDRQPAGIAYLRSFIERYPRMPHLAIGGIDANNVAHLVEARPMASPSVPEFAARMTLLLQHVKLSKRFRDQWRPGCCRVRRSAKRQASTGSSR